MSTAACRLATAALTFLAALLTPASASAHAYLVRSTPAAGAQVVYAPTRVVLEFTEAVVPLGGTDVSGPGGRSVSRAPAHRRGPRSIVLPLEGHLRDGRYLVRWHEVSADDGHVVRGSFQFAVGRSAAVSNGLSQSGSGPSLGETLARWLLIISVLVAGGLVAFRRLVLLPMLEDDAARARESPVTATALAIALAATAAAASILFAFDADASRTGYARRMLAGAIVAGVAAVLAAVRRHRGPPVAVEAAAAGLLVLPSVTGHAVGASQDQAVSLPGDLVHVAAAAFWIGGVAASALVVPAVLRVMPDADRGAATAAILRRFGPLALVAVIVVAATGLVRAVGELGSVHELWTTGYGRTLLAKSVALGVALALAAANRDRPSTARLRRELAVLAVLVGLVALLTSLSPGRDIELAAASTATTPRARVTPVVVAGHVGDLALGVSIAPGDARATGVRATVIGPDGPRNGLVVRFGGPRAPAARPCGDGCYRGEVPIVRGRPRLDMRIGSPGATEHAITLPAAMLWPAPNATVLLRRAERTWRRLRTLSAVSRIASDPQHLVTTRWRFQSPDRLAYRNVPNGAEAVVIGGRRWDRQSSRSRWTSSRQERLRQPVPPWTRRTTSVHLLGAAAVGGRPVWRISFLDKATPAWFTIFVDRRDDRTLRVDMIAQSHFMRQTNSGFDGGAAIAAPR